tara:strand:+ start:278 stop:463 length:186 start_codon:yes stop_codon:yes gene_type:complete
MTYADIGVAGLGGKGIKRASYSIAGRAGIKASEHIIIDIASEAGASVIYEGGVGAWNDIVS